MIGANDPTDLANPSSLATRFDCVDVWIHSELHSKISSSVGNTSSGVSIKQINRFEIDGQPRYAVMSHNDNRELGEYRWHTIEDISEDGEPIRYYAGSRAPGIVNSVAKTIEDVENSDESAIQA